MARSLDTNLTATAIGRRANARVRLGIPARLVLLDGQVRCRLLNLSISGAMIGLEPAPQCGVAGFLRFGDLEVFGTVVWAYSKFCGFDFDEPLALDAVTAMRQLADAHPNLDAELQTRALKAWVDGKARIF